MTDVSKWPTEYQAADAIGVSVRTLQRYAEAGKIEIRPRPRQGKKPENVCNPRDVDRLLPAAHVMPADEPEPPAKPTEAMVRANGKPTFDVLGALIALVTQQQKLLAAPEPKPWLTLDEAAEASGLTAAFIRRQIAEAKIAATRGGPHGALRVHRASVLEFRG